ncbi:MAG: O-antigen ligase family protein [bacterium]
MDVLTFIMLQASILLLILGGGGVLPEVVCLVAALACATWGIGVVLRSRCYIPIPGTAPAFPWLEIALALALLFTLITALPLPPCFAPLTGSLRPDQNRLVDIALQKAAALGLFESGTPWFSLSRNRAGTLRMVLLLAASFGSLMLAASLPARLKLAFLHFIALAGAVVAAGGYVSQWQIPQGDTLWWTLPVEHGLPGPVGCFMNRNHFGGFVAMLTPAALALTGHAFRRRKWGNGILFLLVAALMIFALIQSLSRGAMIAFLAGCLALSWLLAFRRRMLVSIGTLAGVGLLALVIYNTSPSVRDRLESFRDPLHAPSVQNRLMEWRESLRVWPHYPVVGAGANALRMVYPQVRQTTSGRWLVFSENEYIQLLVEGGLVGVILASLVWAAYRHRRRSNPDPVPDVITLSLTGAVAVTATHCIFDFPLHLPLYAVVLASLAGLALPAPIDALPRRRALVLAPVFVGLVGCAIISLISAASLRDLDSYHNLRKTDPTQLRRALIWAPTSWHAWYYLGRAACQEGITRRRVNLCYFGEELMTEATRLDPQNYRLWRAVGQTRLSLKDYDRAEAAFARARQLRPWLSLPPIRRDP